jgi:hypothetical protein
VSEQEQVAPAIAEEARFGVEAAREINATAENWQGISITALVHLRIFVENWKYKWTLIP